MVSLEDLDISGNNLYPNNLAKLPVSMGNMKELKQLYLSKISHEQICEISQGNRKSHKFLYVSDNRLTDTPDTIGKNV